MTKIEKYCELIAEKITLEALRTYAKECYIPIIKPETEVLLDSIVAQNTPRKMLELGTAIGYSAIFFANLIGDAGSVDTVEIDAEMVNIARENIGLFGMKERIHVIFGDAADVLKCLDKEYDMIFVDAAKGQYPEYFEHCMRLLRPGGVLVSDNILFNGRILSGEIAPHKSRTIVNRLRTYIQMISSDTRLETNILNIGDGIGISIRKP